MAIGMGSITRSDASKVQVGNYGRIADSIVGWGSSTGQWARIENKCVIGEDVHMKVGCPGQTARVLIVLGVLQQVSIGKNLAGFWALLQLGCRAATPFMVDVEPCAWLQRAVLCLGCCGHIAPKAVRNTPLAQHMMPGIPCIGSALPECLACR